MEALWLVDGEAAEPGTDQLLNVLIIEPRQIFKDAPKEHRM